MTDHTADPDWSDEAGGFIRCCADHDDGELTLVCTQCNEPACSWCFLDGKHIDHPRQNLRLAHETRAVTLEGRLGELGEIVGQLDEHIEAFKQRPAQLDGWAEALTTGSEATFDELKQELDGRKTLLSERVVDLTRKLREESADRVQAYERTMLSLKELAASSKETVAVANPYVFLEHYASLIEQVRACKTLSGP